MQRGDVTIKNCIEAVDTDCSSHDPIHGEEGPECSDVGTMFDTACETSVKKDEL